MANFNVNIDANAVISQKEANETKESPKTVFNEKNYLSARLGPNENSKDIVIRLLPFSPEGGSPFHRIHMHQIKVDKSVSTSGWKRLPCPAKNEVNGSTSPCPFCETSEKANLLRRSSVSEIDKKRYGDVAYANASRHMWVVRCIERGHEEDGVKFWVFTDSRKKDGVYDKIMSIFNTRLAKNKNIFDLNEGKDLILSLSKDSLGHTSISVTDDDELTPLTTDFELGVKWIQDTKQWYDLFTIKPYEYMAILVEGGIPKYDKDLKKWVNIKETLASDSADIDANLNHDNTPKVNDVIEPSYVATSVTDDDDDLPF